MLMVIFCERIRFHKFRPKFHVFEITCLSRDIISTCSRLLESLLHVLSYELLFVRFNYKPTNPWATLYVASLSCYSAILSPKSLDISKAIPQIDSTEYLMLKSIYCSIRVKCQTFSVRWVVQTP